MAVKYLLKTTEVFRLETMTDVEDFHKWLQEDADKQGYQLVGFSWKEKSRASKGEVVDEWYVVSATKMFENEKEPDLPLRRINYDTYEIDHEELINIELGEDFE